MNTLKNAGKHTTLAMYVVRDSIQLLNVRHISKVKADFGRFKIITINIQPELITLEDKVEHITDILNQRGVKRLYIILLNSLNLKILS